MHWGRRIGLGMAATAMIGGTLVGGSVVQFSAAVAGDRDAAKQAKAAAKQAKLAERALKRGAHDEAIGRAEQAVLIGGKDGPYRALLGRAYLAAGRFTSAAQAFEDAAAAGEIDGKTALHLALARIATGEWARARQVLEGNAATIPATDRGLAIALAGDPMAAVEVLAHAARAPDATAKTRQNLALALALAGKWPEARTIAMLDLQPADADRRLVEWAKFARPARASDQVASLLGVTAVEDGGMPVQLALREPETAVAIAQVPVPVTAYEAKEVVEAAPEPVAVRINPVPVPTAFLEEPRGPERARIVFANRHEIVQSLPTGYAPPPLLAGAASPVAQMPSPAPTRVEGGRFYVQLGAFDDATVARAAWMRMAGRVPALRDRTPQGMSVTTPAGQFYRLSVGGFVQEDAASLCRTVRSAGGNCFVRRHAGEMVASWAKGPRYAAR